MRRAPHAQPARHAGRAVRRIERREPKPLAEAFSSTSAGLLMIGCLVFLPRLRRQDLHVAAPRLEILYANWNHSPRRRAWRGATQPDPDRHLQALRALLDALVAAQGGRYCRPCGRRASVAASCCATNPPSRGSPPAMLPRGSTGEVGARRRQRSVQALAQTREDHPGAHDRIGYFPHSFIGPNERLTDHLALPAAHQPRERRHVRARRAATATGSSERPLGVSGTHARITLAGAAQTIRPLRCTCSATASSS